MTRRVINDDDLKTVRRIRDELRMWAESDKYGLLLHLQQIKGIIREHEDMLRRRCRGEDAPSEI
jgi:hypothetical protein